MPRWPVVLLILVGIACISASGQGTAQAPPKAGPAQSPAGTLALVRSVSGSDTVEEGGQFIIRDPRSAFYLTRDTVVVVYFEWDGQPGVHEFEGNWKDPSSRIVAISRFSYEAKQNRFGAYWKLNLNEQIQAGLWSLESRVDGEYAGTHTVEIVAGAAPALSARRILTVSEIYQSAQAGIVSIETLDPGGRVINQGSGFLLQNGASVLTAFHVIDGSASIRVSTNDQSIAVNALLAWNRRLDFAVLQLPAGSTPAGLPTAEPDSWHIGDRVFALDALPEGGRSILEGTITGQSNSPQSGNRLAISLAPQVGGSGGPLLNQFGEVIGIVHSSAWALSGGSLRSRQSQYFSAIIRFDQASALPLTAFPGSWPENPTPLAELAHRGVLTPPLVQNDDLVSGVLTGEVVLEKDRVRSADVKREFRRGVDEINVLLTWSATKKAKHTIAFQLFNIDNERIASTKPEKLSFSKNTFGFTRAAFPTARLPAGLFRIDAILNDAPIWRAYLRLVD